MDNDDDDIDVEYKIILAGESMVGKTTLFKKVSTGIFRGNNISTIGIDKKTFELEIKAEKEGKEFQKKVKINLVDTGAQEKFQVITKRYFRWANAALLLYDITNKKTFDNLNHWLNFINKNINPNGYHKEYLIFLMGTKLDIVNQFPEKRQVKEEDAKEFCQNECLIWKGECSSKDFSDENYKKILSEIAQELFKNFKPQKVVKLKIPSSYMRRRRERTKCDA